MGCPYQICLCSRCSSAPIQTIPKWEKKGRRYQGCCCRGLEACSHPWAANPHAHTCHQHTYPIYYLSQAHLRPSVRGPVVAQRARTAPARPRKRKGRTAGQRERAIATVLGTQRLRTIKQVNLANSPFSHKHHQSGSPQPARIALSLSKAT